MDRRYQANVITYTRLHDCKTYVSAFLGAKSVSSYLKFGDNSKVYSVAGNGETFLLPSPLTSDQNVTFGFTDSNTDWLSIKLYSGGSSCSSGIPAPSVTANPNNIYQGQSSTLTATCSSGAPEWQTLGSGASKSVSPSTTTTYNAKCVSNGISSSWASTTVTVDPNNGSGGVSISSMTITTNCPYPSGKGINFTPSGGSGQYQYMLQNDGTWKETSVALQWHPNWALSFNLKIRDKLNTSDIASYTVNVNQCGQAGSWSSDGGGLRIGTLQLNTTEEKSETLILYPSPVSDELNVQINSKDSFSVLKLTNTKGALLREFRITDNTMKIVDLNFLIPGVYFILVENKKKRFIKRFVKE